MSSQERGERAARVIAEAEAARAEYIVTRFISDVLRRARFDPSAILDLLEPPPLSLPGD